MKGDLEDMIDHKMPEAAVVRIRALSEVLKATWRKVVGSSRITVRVKDNRRQSGC